jgi:hemerythrin superfamily protein
MDEQNISIQDPFEHIKEDHKKAMGLIEKISEADEDDVATREEFFPQVNDALTLHAEMEEQAFYPALEAVKETQPLVEEALQDHEEMKALLEELSDMPKESEEWMDKFEELRDAVEEHAQEEETRTIPKAQDAFTEDQKEELRKSMGEFLKANAG